MTTLDKDIVREDLEFIADYITDFLRDHPELNEDVEKRDLVKKLDRRMNDILRRLEG